MRILTIGGYGFTERGFVNALKSAGVDVFVDVRQRRGMRGAKYAFLNSKRLQSTLSEASIRYIHATELVPTSEIRDVQKLEDRTNDISKRARANLSPGFVQKYQSDILEKFDPDDLRRAIGDANAIALFCVETQPSACHRHLAANYLKNAFLAERPVEHLRP